MSNNPAVTLRIQKILVPVDFSKGSDAAVDYAVAMAKQFGAAITLLHVVEPFHPGSFAEGYVEEQVYHQRLKNAQNLLKDLIETRVRPHATGQFEVKEGSPALTITEFASRMVADLIVIATHGHTGVKHLLIGSVAEKVVRHARCPVLAVRCEQ